VPTSAAETAAVETTTAKATAVETATAETTTMAATAAAPPRRRRIRREHTERDGGHQRDHYLTQHDTVLLRSPRKMPRDHRETLERLSRRCSSYPAHICATFCQRMITV
jgi:hypothetical protein